MKIGVIGAGRLGITFALLCEKAGHEVIVSDIKKEYINKINNKIIDTTEPKVSSMLYESKNLRATLENSEVITESDVIYTFVQTPSLPSGEYDISYLMKVVEDFKKIENFKEKIKDKLFVIGCTTNPGDTKTIEEELKPFGVIVNYNPEFIAQGEIVKGLEYADLVLVGTSNLETVNILKQIYDKIQKIDVKMCSMSPTAAEITKIGINCFLTTKISYANMIGEILVSSNLHDEVDKVLTTIGTDSRIGQKYLNYGFGFGGPCLPRDNRALGKYAKKVGIETNLPFTIDDFNIEHSMFLKSYFMKQNPNKKVPFVFDYISYKKGTDMLVESQQLKLAKDLLNEGYSVSIIEEDSILNNLKFVSQIQSNYPNQVKFYKLGSNPKGFKININ